MPWKSTVVPIVLKAIPYYAWNSRGAAHMLVWMSEMKDKVFAKSGWGKEMEATASSSLEWVWGLNTGFDPWSRPTLMGWNSTRTIP